MPAPVIIYDNASDRATISGDSLGDGVLANLVDDRRSQVWLANAPASLSLIWTEAEAFDTVCLARTNLTALATLHLVGYNAGAVVLDTTFQAIPTGWTGEDAWWGVTPLDGYAARPGIAGYALVRLAEIARVDRLDIMVSDVSLATIEAARLIVGSGWQPSHAVHWGSVLSVVADGGRDAWLSDGGDYRPPSVRHMRRKLTFKLPAAGDADRDAAAQLAWRVGAGTPVLVILTPGATNPQLERDNTIYGFAADPATAWQSFGLWTTDWAVTEF